MATAEHGVKKLVRGIESLSLISKVRKNSRVSKARRVPRRKSPLHGKFRPQNRARRSKVNRKSHERLISKEPFARLVREIMSDLGGSTKDPEVNDTKPVLAMESSGPTLKKMDTKETLTQQKDAQLVVPMKTRIPDDGPTCSEV